MLKKLSKWWFGLDSALQYMYSVIAFAGTMILACLGIILFEPITPTATLITLSVIGVSVFVCMFLLVVIFMVNIWPHLVKEKKRK